MTGRQSEDSAALLIDQGLTVVCVIVVNVKPDALSDPAHLVVCTMSYTPYVLRLTYVCGLILKYMSYIVYNCVQCTSHVYDHMYRPIRYDDMF